MQLRRIEVTETDLDQKIAQRRRTLDTGAEALSDVHGPGPGVVLVDLTTQLYNLVDRVMIIIGGDRQWK